MEAELQRVRDELLSTSRTAATAERSAKRLQKFKADLLALLTVSDDEQAVLAEVARLRSVYSQSFSGEKDAGAAVANAFFQIDTAVSDWDELVDQAEAFVLSLRCADACVNVCVCVHVRACVIALLRRTHHCHHLRCP